MFKLFAYIGLKIVINSIYLQSALRNMSHHVTSEINCVLIGKRYSNLIVTPSIVVYMC